MNCAEAVADAEILLEADEIPDDERVEESRDCGVSGVKNDGRENRRGNVGEGSGSEILFVGVRDGLSVGCRRGDSRLVRDDPGRIEGRALPQYRRMRAASEFPCSPGESGNGNGSESRLIVSVLISRFRYRQRRFWIVSVRELDFCFYSCANRSSGAGPCRCGKSGRGRSVAFDRRLVGRRNLE